MTIFISQAGAAATGPGATGWIALITVATLLLLQFEKAVATNVSAPGFHRLARCLDVGIAPLEIAVVVYVTIELVRMVGAVR
jgi:hypothetical protein